MTNDLAMITATDLLTHYRRKTLSPVEVTEAVLARIDQCEPALNAFCVLDGDFAMAEARDSEQRWQSGEPVGLLDGVPTTIKDVVAAKGWPTRRGSRTSPAEGPWDVDAPASARVREHGAVLLGKTTTPEYGWKGVTDCPLTGTTRNPWNTDSHPAARAAVRRQPAQRVWERSTWAAMAVARSACPARSPASSVSRPRPVVCRRFRQIISVTLSITVP